MLPRIELAELTAAIHEVIAGAREQEVVLAAELERIDPSHRDSARNLAHYLALRQHDLRELQRGLAAQGLSSLGRAERCVMATLVAVERALAALSERPPSALEPPPISFESADELLEQRTSALLGPAPAGRSARIMITLATTEDASRIDALLAAGADVVRLNCAKGTREDWSGTIERVRSAAQRRRREVSVLCDLAGPNPRTAPLERRDQNAVLGRLRVGDDLFLCRPGTRWRERRGLAVGCTLPEVLDDVAFGDRLYYDDGKLSGVVRETTADGARVEITFARKERVKVRAGKGLNFPDSRLRVPSLTPKDFEDLEFIARRADMVGLSFVRTVAHVEQLQQELERLGAGGLGIVLKIETTQAFEALPRLLLTALRSPRVGIMVARGDMAIELGFERLAEAQEEILWISEAAHVPVIWATQVLEGLNKTGIPSRAEVTDAAMASRAECVMLNQGEYLLVALRFLCDVLERMEQHQRKKRAMLRRLRISRLSTASDGP